MGKKKLHYLWSLKDNGIIDNAMVSFSVTSKEMGETPYALFGGYNSSQIVGDLREDSQFDVHRFRRLDSHPQFQV